MLTRSMQQRRFDEAAFCGARFADRPRKLRCKNELVVACAEAACGPVG
jgi:hypothetical protein